MTPLPPTTLPFVRLRLLSSLRWRHLTDTQWCIDALHKEGPCDSPVRLQPSLVTPRSENTDRCIPMSDWPVRTALSSSERTSYHLLSFTYIYILSHDSTGLYDIVWHCILYPVTTSCSLPNETKVETVVPWKDVGFRCKCSNRAPKPLSEERRAAIACRDFRPRRRDEVGCSRMQSDEAWSGFGMFWNVLEHGEIYGEILKFRRAEDPGDRTQTDPQVPRAGSNMFECSTWPTWADEFLLKVNHVNLDTTYQGTVNVACPHDIPTRGRNAKSLLLLRPCLEPGLLGSCWHRVMMGHGNGRHRMTWSILIYIQNPQRATPRCSNTFNLLFRDFCHKTSNNLPKSLICVARDL